jgi:hypothetical protein
VRKGGPGPPPRQLCFTHENHRTLEYWRLWRCPQGLESPQVHKHQHGRAGRWRSHFYMLPVMGTGLTLQNRMPPDLDTMAGRSPLRCSEGNPSQGAHSRQPRNDPGLDRTSQDLRFASGLADCLMLSLKQKIIVPEHSGNVPNTVTHSVFHSFTLGFPV